MIKIKMRASRNRFPRFHFSAGLIESGDRCHSLACSSCFSFRTTDNHHDVESARADRYPCLGPLGLIRVSFVVLRRVLQRDPSGSQRGHPTTYQGHLCPARPCDTRPDYTIMSLPDLWLHFRAKGPKIVSVWLQLRKTTRGKGGPLRPAACDKNVAWLRDSNRRCAAWAPAPRPRPARPGGRA